MSLAARLRPNIYINDRLVSQGVHLFPWGYNTEYVIRLGITLLCRFSDTQALKPDAIDSFHQQKGGRVNKKASK